MCSGYTTPNAGPLYSGHPGWTGRPPLSNFQLLILTIKVAVFFGRNVDVFSSLPKLFTDLKLDAYS